jgi:hypothetical protein
VKFRMSVMKVLAAASMFAAAIPLSAQAQEPQLQYKNVISANPFGLLLELFNAEYERVIGESSTIGFGGSTFNADAVGDFEEETADDRYLNADVFYRFYPSGRPLDGWAFGVKAGITSVTDAGTYAGFGFDVNRSWLLGKRENFYVGIGFGLKRLLGTDDEEIGMTYIPTFRIVNVGFAF